MDGHAHRAFPLPSLRLDTRSLPEAERRELVRQRIGECFEVSVPDREPAAYSLDSSAWLLGQTLINSRTCSPLRLTRSARRIRADGLDHYLINVTRAGHWQADLGGTTQSGAAGSVMVLDMGRPLDATASASTTVGCTLPRDTLDRLVPGGIPHGTLLPGPAAALLADYIALLERRLPQLTAAEAPFVERATAELIAACVLPTADRLEQAAAPLSAALRAQAARLVERRLHDPELSAALIAAALKISRASLYRLFEGDGGVDAFIWARRLRRARRLLADAGERRRISQIAAACGFQSDAHFSRAFRRAYGTTPSEARAVGIPEQRARSAAPEQALRDYQRWVTDLSA